MQQFPENINTLFHLRIETPVGTLISIASEKGISVLLFSDDELFKQDAFSFTKSKTNKNKHLIQLEDEIVKYFNGKLQSFQTALDPIGTSFQFGVWENLRKISYGNTQTYGELATISGSIKKIRAVANANSKNRILLLIPCHRVVGEGNKITGYRGGIERKRWLINFENDHSDQSSKSTLF